MGKQSKYFSLCKPPTGVDECDWSMAKSEVAAARKHLKNKEDDVTYKERRVKDAEESLKDARIAHTKAVALAKKRIATFGEKKKIEDKAIAKAGVDVTKV